MVPAQQRLEARDGAILQPDDRLEIDLDLVALDGAAQVGLERQPVRRACARMPGRNISMRLPPARLAWAMAISASLSMSSRLACSSGS